jgi:hypothetical protein
MTHWVVFIFGGLAGASLDEALNHPDALAGFLTDEDDTDWCDSFDPLSASSSFTLDEQLESAPVSGIETTPNPYDFSKDDLWEMVLSALSEDADNEKSAAAEAPATAPLPVEQLVVLRSLQANIDMSSEELLARIRLQRPDSEWTLSSIDSFVSQAKFPIQIPDWLHTQLVLASLKIPDFRLKNESNDPRYNDPAELNKIAQVWAKFCIDKVPFGNFTPYLVHRDAERNIHMSLTDVNRYEYLEWLTQREVLGVCGLTVTGLKKKRRGSPTLSESSSSALKRARSPPSVSLREAVLICMLRAGLGSIQEFVEAVTAMYPSATLKTVNRMRTDILSFTIVSVAFHKRLSSLKSWEELTPTVLDELAKLDPRTDSAKRASVWFEYCILNSSARKRQPCYARRGNLEMTLSFGARDSYIRAELRAAHS